MKPYDIRFTKVAVNDFKRLTPKLKKKLGEIISQSISKEPYGGKKLVGELAGFYSVRLTYKDRIVYSIHEGERVVFIHRAKTHYGE